MDELIRLLFSGRANFAACLAAGAALGKGAEWATQIAKNRFPAIKGWKAVFLSAAVSLSFSGLYALRFSEGYTAGDWLMLAAMAFVASNGMYMSDLQKGAFRPMATEGGGAKTIEGGA